MAEYHKAVAPSVGPKGIMLLQNPNVKPVDQDSLKSSLVSLNRERNKTFTVSCLPSVKMIRSKAMDPERPNSFYSHGAGYTRRELTDGKKDGENKTRQQ